MAFIKYTINCSICSIKSSCRRNISSASSSKIAHDNSKTIYSRFELDSHADSIVTGANCCIMHYTSRECDVSPFRDDYSPIKNVPIVQAGTAYQSEYTGQTHILIFNEALWMGGAMQHTLVNPNQLRYFGIQVQDNLMSSEPLSIIKEDESFNLELKIKGTNIFADTHTPSKEELNTCKHIVLSSPHECAFI